MERLEKQFHEKSTLELAELLPDTRVLRSRFFLENAPPLSPEMIGTSTRVGISRSRELPWRKFIRNNPHISQGKVTQMLKNESCILESLKK